jgi:hypothetical protein
MTTVQRLRQHNLLRIIRVQMVQMALVVFGVIGLIHFASRFINEGVKANATLNLAIIGLFAFGVVLAFRRLFAVQADATAFAALQEAFDDARRERAGLVDDPYWRHYRCMEPGIVFRRPRSLGHMFDIAYDELLQAKSLQISVSTMQNIVGPIETRLAEERARLGYLANLLVFLGLIGTFIGLMEMVGSVGGIIGGLNTTDANSTDAMKSLLQSLQAPLNGMATGFSSSLFGLFGSLVIGVLSRMGTKAINAFKDEFSTWLASISHMDPASADNRQLARLMADNIAQGGSGGSGGASISDAGVVATMAQGFARINSGVESVGQNLPRMLEIQEDNATIMRALLERFDRLIAENGEMRNLLGTLVAGQQGQAEHAQEMINQLRSNEAKLTAGFNGMAHIMEVTGQAYLDGLRRLTSENYETNARLAKLLDLKAAGDRIAEVAVAIEGKVKNGFGGLVSAMERTAISVESSMQRMSAEQEQIKQLVTERAGGEVSMSRDFEERLGAGFSELSRSFETVFAAYSTIINRSLAQQGTQQPVDAKGIDTQTARTNAALPEHESVGGAAGEPEIDHEELRRRLYAAAAARKAGRVA